MIAYISGTLTGRPEGAAIVETGGVGFFVWAPASAELPELGEKIKLYTYMLVKEDDLALYGFLTERDVKIFRMLIGVTGVGPKAALAILSALSADAVIAAIITNDEASLSMAEGVGKKTAQRISLELRDKVKNFSGMTGAANTQLAMASAGRQEAADALISLGYSRADSLKAVMEADAGDLKTEQIIRIALRKLAAR